MIVGVGIDVVDVARFGATLERTPALLERLFTAAERAMALNSQAARFAAKEALAKALGAPAGMLWQDAEVHRGADGRPHFEVRGTVRAARRGARRHDDPRLAVARRRHRLRRRHRGGRGNGRRAVIEAWSTDDVYAAEAALMAGLDEGELMARAVEGLAEVVAARLEERDGAAVAALVGPGNNGADALYAVARLAEAGWNAVAVHHDQVHEGARAAAEAAGVVLTTDPAAAGARPTSCSTASSGSVRDPVCRRGPSDGWPPCPTRRTSSPSTSRRVTTRWAASSTPTGSSPTRR